METLPNELQKKILDRVGWDVDTLISCSQVCSSWEQWSQELFNQKGPLHMLKTYEEIKAMTRIQITDETTGERNYDGLEVFKTFRRTYLPPYPNYQIGEDMPEESSPDIPNSWLGSISELRKCGCQTRYAERVCLTSGLRFMPGHGLIMIAAPGALYVFGEADPVNSLTDESCCGPYKIEPRGFHISDDAHSCVSIYQDYFVAQDNSNCFVYCKVSKVDDTNRTLWIDTLRRVSTPISTDHLVLFKQRVFIIHTTASISVWTVDSDDTEICSDKLQNGHYKFHSMNRLNNLLLIGYYAPDDQRQSPYPSWVMIDADAEKPELECVPLGGFVQFLEWKADRNSYGNGLEVQLLRAVSWNNALILHCQVQNRKTGEVNPNDKRIVALRLKRDPELGDFGYMWKFENLFFPESVARIQQDLFNFKGSHITSPFLDLQKGEQKKVANIFGHGQVGDDPDQSTHNLVLNAEYRMNM